MRLIFFLSHINSVEPIVHRKNLGKVGIQWQRRPEKRWLAELLADRHAVGPVLEFLRNNEVGSRDGGAEREKEWEQRRDQDGENQLESGEQKCSKAEYGAIGRGRRDRAKRKHKGCKNRKNIEGR